MRRHRQTSPLFLLLLVAAVLVPMIPAASGEPEATNWVARIADMDQALQRGDAPATQAAWREAYVAAHVSRTWSGMLAVGDAAIRASGLVGVEVSDARARRAYLTALLRARRQGSLDGVLAAGDAFGRLGDRAVVRQALAVATDLAERSGDGAARHRVEVFQAHWAPRT